MLGCYLQFPWLFSEIDLISLLFRGNVAIWEPGCLTASHNSASFPRLLKKSAALLLGELSKLCQCHVTSFRS